MLQDQLTGVGFVLTVIHVNVELISLGKQEERGPGGLFYVVLFSGPPSSLEDERPPLTQVTKQ